MNPCIPFAIIKCVGNEPREASQIPPVSDTTHADQHTSRAQAHPGIVN
ncbi:MAG: hypothetical protein NXI29_19215 [bacterium]|nr:hypothetical protein [bacterium]